MKVERLSREADILGRNNIETKILCGGSGLVRCRLIYSITPTVADVKGGEAVHRSVRLRTRRPLTSDVGGVTRASSRQSTPTAERE